MNKVSVSSRLPSAFKFVFKSGGDVPQLQLSGSIETQDQLDAVSEALTVMRDWLPPDSSTQSGERG